MPNLGGKFLRLAAVALRGRSRKTRKATSAIGGELKSGAAVEGWRAEVFIPYELLVPLRNTPPKAGHAVAGELLPDGLRRQDQTSWDWARVGTSFHEYQKFGTLVFE